MATAAAQKRTKPAEQATATECRDALSRYLIGGIADNVKKAAPYQKVTKRAYNRTAGATSETGWPVTLEVSPEQRKIIEAYLHARLSAFPSW